MKLRIATILIIGIISLLSSCNGQVKSEATQVNINNISIGKIVDQLDSKANLIFQDKENNYWFGSEDKGVYRYNGETLQLFTLKDGLVSKRIISVQDDKYGNLYFDTPEGIVKFDGHKFSTLKVEEKDISNNHWRLQPDDLWFRMGWNKNGPYRYDGIKLYPLEFPKNEMEDKFNAKYPNASYNPYGVYSIFKDSKGNMWFGTSSLGIYHYDGKKISWMYERQLTKTPQGGDFGIRSIVEDKNGFYWICNTNYKYKVLPENTENSTLYKLNIKRETGIENKENQTAYFLSMLNDDNGDIWLQSYDDGVWQNKGNELFHHPIKNGKEDVLLSSIYKDNNGELWAGTKNNGAYKYDGETFKKFKIK